MAEQCPQCHLGSMSVGFRNPSLSLMPQLPSVTESGLCAETRLTTQSLMPIGARAHQG